MMKKFVIAAALVISVSTVATAQTYYNPYSQYLPQPRANPPQYLPPQPQQFEQFNPPPPQPTIGNLPAYNNYCLSLGGQITTNCNR